MIDTSTLDAYNKRSAAYAQDWHEQPPPADLHAIVRQYFLKGLTADVGCGSGRDTSWLCDNGYPAIGFDASEGLLDDARNRYPKVQFVHAALPELRGVSNGGFANVLCETVIMHLDRESIAPSVGRLLDLLEVGGTLYLSWRVTEGSDRRDEHGRLYAVFDPSLVRSALSGANILLDEQKVGESSGKMVHRLVARKK